VNPIKRIKFPK